MIPGSFLSDTLGTLVRNYCYCTIFYMLCIRIRGIQGEKTILFLKKFLKSLNTNKWNKETQNFSVTRGYLTSPQSVRTM
jgi:hypothetical protein